MIAEVCKPVQRLISVKAAWTWNRSYQEIYKRAKVPLKEDMCREYYHARKLVYLETDTSGVTQGITLLQIRDNINC